MPASIPPGRHWFRPEQRYRALCACALSMSYAVLPKTHMRHMTFLGDVWADFDATQASIQAKRLGDYQAHLQSMQFTNAFSLAEKSWRNYRTMLDGAGILGQLSQFFHGTEEYNARQAFISALDSFETALYSEFASIVELIQTEDCSALKLLRAHYFQKTWNVADGYDQVQLEHMSIVSVLWGVSMLLTTTVALVALGGVLQSAGMAGLLPTLFAEVAAYLPLYALPNVASLVLAIAGGGLAVCATHAFFNSGQLRTLLPSYPSVRHPYLVDKIWFNQTLADLGLQLDALPVFIVRWLLNPRLLVEGLLFFLKTMCFAIIDILFGHWPGMLQKPFYGLGMLLKWWVQFAFLALVAPLQYFRLRIGPLPALEVLPFRILLMLAKLPRKLYYYLRPKSRPAERHDLWFGHVVPVIFAALPSDSSGIESPDKPETCPGGTTMGAMPCAVAPGSLDAS